MFNHMNSTVFNEHNRIDMWSRIVFRLHMILFTAKRNIALFLHVQSWVCEIWIWDRNCFCGYLKAKISEVK